MVLHSSAFTNDAVLRELLDRRGFLLVVDHDYEIRCLFQRSVTDQGYRLVEAASAGHTMRTAFYRSLASCRSLPLGNVISQPMKNHVFKLILESLGSNACGHINSGWTVYVGIGMNHVRATAVA